MKKRKFWPILLVGFSGLSPPPSLSRLVQDALGAEIEAVADDIVEAAEYARTMSAEEIEDTIGRIVEYVRTRHSFTSGHANAMLSSVVSQHGDDPVGDTPLLAERMLSSSN